MRHALMYHGGYEKNAPNLKPGATTFIGSDGAEHALPAWPAEVDGLRVGYMEKPGKHFAAVRVQEGKVDIVLNHSVLLDPSRHLGYGKRFSAEPTVIDDEIAHVLLDDIVARNPEQAAQLESLRHRVPRGDKKKTSDS
ncbi:MAG: hypothetical protein M3081_17530 [Gemmatimonadota bacterium]|nr:hypothetical protein [Gemmatimonadota bacterium]